MRRIICVPKKSWQVNIYYTGTFHTKQMIKKFKNFYMVKILIENQCNFYLKIQLIIMRLFYANMVSRVSYQVNLIQILKYKCILHLKVMRPLSWFYFIIREFHRKYFVEEFFLCLTSDFGKLFIVREHWGQNSIYAVIFPQKSFNLLEDRQILALMFPFIFV